MIDIIIFALEGDHKNSFISLGIRYKFSQSGIYFVPEPANYYGCIRYIKKLPLNPSPEVFGLHENANITKGNQETQQVGQIKVLYRT